MLAAGHSINPREYTDIRSSVLFWSCFPEEGRQCCSFSLQLLEGKKFNDLTKSKITCGMLQEMFIF